MPLTLKEQLEIEKQRLEIEKLRKEIKGLSPVHSLVTKAAAFAPLLVALAAIFYGYKSNLFETKDRELALRKENLQHQIIQFEKQKAVLEDSIVFLKQTDYYFKYYLDVYLKAAAAHPGDKHYFDSVVEATRLKNLPDTMIIK